MTASHRTGLGLPAGGRRALRLYGDRSHRTHFDADPCRGLGAAFTHPSPREGDGRHLHLRRSRRAPRGHGPDPRSQHPRAALPPLGEENLLKHPTLDQLHTLGLYGMATAFTDLAAAGQAKDLAHADWLALLLDRETSWRSRPTRSIERQVLRSAQGWRHRFVLRVAHHIGRFGEIASHSLEPNAKSEMSLDQQATSG
jgi:hypothetical protein